MVEAHGSFSCVEWVLSVLALSSRFDGLLRDAGQIMMILPFSTRSVESF